MKNENSTFKLFTSVKSLLLKALLLFAIFNLGSVQVNAQCPTPTGLSNGLISATSATINWNNMAGAIYYKIRYRVQTPVGAWVNTTSTPNTKFIVGLTQNTAYEYQVKSVCNSIGNESSFSSTGTFTTGSQCIVPTNLAIVSSTATTITISWTGVGSWYSTRYRTTSPLGSWVYGSSVPTSKIFAGLTPNTSYEFQVASNCTSDPLQSPFSNSLIINTFCSSYSNTSSTISACDSYVWPFSGASYTNSGIYKDTNTTCQISTLNLTINNSSTSSSSATACDSYTWSCNGTTYTASGAYTCTSMNAAGCVHTETLDLTINASPVITSTSATPSSICAGQTSQLDVQSIGCSTGCTYNITSIPLAPTTPVGPTNPGPAGDDQVSGAISIGFPFTFHCNTYTQLWISTNGYITFSDPFGNSGCCSGQFIPNAMNPNNLIAIDWTDLATAGWGVHGAGNIDYYTLTSPNRMVIRYNNVGTFNSSGHLTGEIILYDNGSVEIHSSSITTAHPNQTQGLENDLGTIATVVSGRNSTSWTTSGDAYRFTPTSATSCTYSWSPAVSLSNASISNPIASLSASETYTVSVTSASGCTATSTVTVNVTPNTTNVTTTSSCDTYTWSVDGQTYTVSGSYNYVNPLTPCHTETLDLTINNSTAHTTYETACDSYTWSCNSATYTNSGTWTCTSLNAAGCVHTETLDLTINNSTAHTTYETACDSYTWSCNSATYTNSGTWTCTSLNAAGCVHTETLDLTINNSTAHTTYETACDSYTWSCNSATYTNSGTWTCTSMNAAGCVHTETLDLTINNSTAHTTFETACDMYTWSCNGMMYMNSGTWTCTSMNAAGCVHTETLDLTINNSTAHTTYETACDSYTWSCNSATYTNSGTWTCTSLNAAGCVHTETLDLTINNSTAHTTYETACDSYTWSCNSASYTNSGTWTCTSLNAAGCVHTETLDLTINNSTANTTSVTACDMYTWSCNGSTYTNSGTWTCTSMNAAGCVHTETLDLTINNSTANTINVSACVSYTWTCNGMMYTNSGSWTCTSINAAGCLHTETLNLTINALPTVTASNVSACPGSPVPLMGNPAGGTFSIANPYLGSSTTYTYTYTDANGCTNTSSPALVTVNLAVPIYNFAVSQVTGSTVLATWTGAPGVTWYQLRYKPVSSSTWSPSITQFAPTNQKYVTGLNSNTTYEIQIKGFCGTNTTGGPWSTSAIFTTDPPCNTPTGLTVSNITNTNVTLSWNPAVGAAYYGIRYKRTSASVWTMGTSTPTMKLLTGLTPGAQYEFQVQSYCGTPTPGPYTASIVWTQATTIPPTAGGKIVGTEEELISNVNIYPNPTSNVLNIDLMVTESSNTIIKVLDMSGRLIKQTQVKSEKGLNPITIDLSELASGIYALQILENEKVTHISKVEKK